MAMLISTNERISILFAPVAEPISLVRFIVCGNNIFIFVCFEALLLERNLGNEE